MTVKHLIEQLQEMPPDADVYIPMGVASGTLGKMNVCIHDIDGDVVIG